jgi:hypothetical protein
MSENKALRRIFGTKKVERRSEWRKAHNEKLHNLYSLRNNVVVSRMVSETGGLF